MPWNTAQNLTISTYQSADGSNFTTGGFDLKFKGGVGVYLGMGTDFKSDAIGVVDLKENNPYAKGSLFSQNLRIRSKYGDELLSTQVRFSPCTVNVPLKNGKTSLYLNPHYVGTYDSKKSTWKNAAGAFLGVTHKFNNDLSVSAEVQRYNLQDITDNSGKNWSGNVIMSVRLP